MSISKIFIPNFVRVLTNKRKYIEQNFYSGAGVMPQGWDLGVLGVKNFSVGICDGAPSIAHSSCILWYPGTGVVPDCIISRSLPYFLLK